MVKEVLNKCVVSEDDQAHIQSIIATMSFKGAGVSDEMDTIEGKVVQDADRLDALGAIGVGRVFSYGGFANRPMHDPDENALLHGTKEEYQSRSGTTINYFYEKLLLLTDRMKTTTGRKVAEERTKFMQDFLAQFYAEWDGKK